MTLKNIEKQTPDIIADHPFFVISGNFIIFFLFLGLCFILNLLGNSFMSFPPLVFLSAGLALSSALIGGKNYTWGIFLGGFTSTYVLYPNDANILNALVFGVFNTFSCVFSTLLIQNYKKYERIFSSTGNIVVYLLIGVLFNSFLSSLSSFFVDGFIRNIDYDSHIWFQWFISYLMGILVLSPTLLVWWYDEDSQKQVTFAQWLENFFISLFVVIATFAMFLVLKTNFLGLDGLPFLLIIPLSWLTIRFSAKPALSLVTLIAFIGTIGIANEVNTFPLEKIRQALMSLSFMISSFVIMILSIHALVAERKRSERIIIEQNNLLEHRVMQRTLELEEQHYKLEQSIKFQQALIDAIPTPTYFEDSYGLCKLCNSALEDLIGFNKEYIVEHSLSELGLHTIDSAQLFDTMTFQDIPIRRYETTAIFRDVEFHLIYSRSPFYSGNNKQLTGYICTLVDISQRKRLENDLKHMANTDALTGVANRRQFMQLAEIEVQRSRRFGYLMSVMMFDIDHFKQVNDTYGHSVGDDVLRVVAKICTDCVREYDIVGRLGGEEFAIVLPETDLRTSLQVAERVRQAIEIYVIRSHHHSIHITVSVGVDTIQPEDANIEIILERADKSLYIAKQSGRNCVISCAY